jgi:protoporphyrinogen IX oxidase
MALMVQVLAMIYLWLKAGHVIFVIFWMAGLFMLPRFFVYHQEAAPDSAENAVWIDRENKLLKIIMWPSLVAVWVLGLALSLGGDWVGSGWLTAKIGLVMALSAYHVWLAGYAQRLALGQRTLSGRNLRLLNEVPGIATVLIVILVIVKPF